MTLNEYQNSAMYFAKFASPDYAFTGLAEEVGEVMGKLAKAQRKHGKSQARIIDMINFGQNAQLQSDLVKELGDVLWMLQACANVIGVDLETIAEENLTKLTDRLERNVICGQGDNR